MRWIVFPLLLFLSGAAPPETTPDLGRGRPGDALYVHHAPDPVNVRNGNFYLPVQDLYLPCFGFPLEIYRSYNSVSTRNGPFGKGWTFNYDLQIVVDEKEGLKIVEADGFINEFVPVELDTGDTGGDLGKIVEAKKSEDRKYLGKPEGKGAAFYDDYRSKLETDEAFLKRQRERYLPKTSLISKSGKYVSRKRGTTYVEKKGDRYVRTAETGRIEEYTAGGLLVRISDRNDNDLILSYDSQSRLQKAADGCDQAAFFSYNNQNKISEIRDHLSRKLQYTYDRKDRLTVSTAPDGEKLQYVYDSRDQMSAITFADGTKTEMMYDPKTGFVRQQLGPGKKLTEYSYGREPDRRWATVKDNEGGRSRYEYLDAENKIIFTDKGGKKTITSVSACCGKPLSIKDEKGVGEEFRYDEKGNLTRKIDARKLATTFRYEPRFNQVSEIKPPDGSSLRFLYEGHGNLSYVSNGKGEHVKLTYEKHGKIETMTNDKEQMVTFLYSRFGKPTKIEKAVKKNRVGSIDVTYDKTGEIARVDYDPKNPETVQNIKETLASFLRLLKPSGIDFEI